MRGGLYHRCLIGRVSRHDTNISNSNGNVAAGGTATRAFGSAGTFRYRCTNHSSGFGNAGEMVGVITTQ